MIAPSSYQVAEFLQPILRTGRYVLYEARTPGYAQFVGLESRLAVRDQAALYASNIAWSRRPTNGQPRTYIRYDYPATSSPSGPSVVPGCPDGGRTDFEAFRPGQIDLVVECSAAATLVIKTTYHPNWEVTVDGTKVPTFMVSPSYLGVSMAPGKHQVDAVYRATPSKAPLLVAGLVAVIVLLLLRGRLDGRPPGWPGWRPAPAPAPAPRRRRADPEPDDYLGDGLGDALGDGLGEAATLGSGDGTGEATPGDGDGMREA